uniref:Uncharacterized protein K02A2.6 n=1 Tax=Lygus hesperus TaxID=30085 RepID=A0A0A9XRD5_LYGHE
MAALRNLGIVCEFDKLFDGLVRDIFTCGVRDNSVKAKLLGMGDVSSDQVLAKARNQAAISKQVQSEPTVKEEPVDVIRRKLPRTTTASIKSKSVDRGHYHESQYIKSCRFCGYNHMKGRCPAFGKICNICRKENHFSSVCKGNARRVNLLQEEDDDVEEEFEMDVLHVDQLEMSPLSTPNGSSEWYTVDLEINGRPSSFKIDTGAQCNVMGIKEYEKIGLRQEELQRAKARSSALEK